MASKLDDFEVKVNLNGWWLRNYGACKEGDTFKGENIRREMIEAIEEGRTFKSYSGRRIICEMVNGKIEDLRKAFDASGDKFARKPIKKKTPHIPRKDAEAQPVEVKKPAASPEFGYSTDKDKAVVEPKAVEKPKEEAPKEEDKPKKVVKKKVVRKPQE